MTERAKNTQTAESPGLLETYAEQEGFDNAMAVLRVLFVKRDGTFKTPEARVEYHTMRKRFMGIYGKNA